MSTHAPSSGRHVLAAIAGAMLQACAAAAAGADLPAAYAPVIAASNARRESAEKSLADRRAKRDALAGELEATEKKLIDLAPAPANPEADTIAGRIRELDAALRRFVPASCTSTVQMAEFDRMTDEREALLSDGEDGERARMVHVRELARRTTQGAELADRWQSLHVALIAAENEATLAQIRRDDVLRAERGLLARIAPRQAEAPAEVVRLDVPPPADAEPRRAGFRERVTAEGVRALGERFFSQMTLTLLGLERVSALAEARRYAEALDEYKMYFFSRLAPPGDAAAGGADEEESRDGEAALGDSVFPPPTPEAIEHALGGIVAATLSAKDGPVRVEAHLGAPGAIHWAFAAPSNDLQLAFCRLLGRPGAAGEALLHSYAVGGPKAHLGRWSEIVDDWALNWQRDVERSPLPLRDYNLLCVCRIQGLRDKLRTVAQMRPEFVDDLPAPTLARLLMAMNEEYLASAIRLGRSGLYNFRIMALNSMIPTSLRMQEFHAHRWAVREGWRQVDNNFVYKIRRDGANVEFANDGHENTDQFMTLPFRALQAWRAQPEWLEPFWAEEFMDNFLSNARYRLHNLKQDGYCYRLSVRPQRARYLGASPEYKVNLLMDEPEVRRRLWKVFHIGQPEDPPRIDSEGMAFQGYYYLRTGWEPHDDFLYFQSIGQPILSGREENTGFSLYGHGGIFLLAPATAVDGRTQNIHHGLVMNPGGKAPYAAYGRPDAVKTGRFLAGERFDLVEGEFAGVYQYGHPRDSFDVFGSYGYEASLAKAQAEARRAGRAFVDEPIRGVCQSRRVLSLRGRALYIVTDVLHSEEPHRFTQNFTIYTPVRLDHLATRLHLLGQEALQPFEADPGRRMIATRNIGLPSIELRHVTACPLEYEIGRGNFGGDLAKFSKRDRQQTDVSRTAQFSRQVAVHWKGEGDQVVVALAMPQGPTYTTSAAPAVVRDMKPIAPRPDLAGFSGFFADGTPVAYLASARPAPLEFDAVEATASALLVAGDRGLALDCSRLSGMAPPLADFTFRMENGRAVVEQPIWRPIKPVVIEPSINVFTDTTTVTLACETPGVEIRYTLDGSRPVPRSPLYTGPFAVDRTCRLQARAFRKGVAEDVWQQDGTHATVVSSAVLRKEPPSPAAATARTAPGLRYEYFEGAWTEVMVRSLTMPAKATGVVARVLDVGPRRTDGAFGIRYEGCLDVPRDGVYTFHAPDEFLYPDNDCGYDLRVFVDGREWYPAVRWHGHGAWSVALGRGKHPFKVVFADLRLRPHKVELMWGFPHPDFTWKGDAPALTISGPDLPRQPIPDSILCHEVQPSIW